MKRRIIQTAIESMTVRSKRKKGKEFDPNWNQLLEEKKWFWKGWHNPEYVWKDKRYFDEENEVTL
jgi:hypothetical protein